MTSREHHNHEHSDARGHGHGHGAPADHGTIVRDPVCGMDVDTRTAKFRYDGYCRLEVASQ